MFKTLITLIALTFISSFLAGCANRPNYAPYSSLNKISVGMSKETVIQILGSPNSSAAQGNTEYLKYIMIINEFSRPRECFVRLVNGKVEAYGRIGDFDSTKDPTIKVQLQ